MDLHFPNASVYRPAPPQETWRFVARVRSNGVLGMGLMRFVPHRTRHFRITTPYRIKH